LHSDTDKTVTFCNMKECCPLKLFDCKLQLEKCGSMRIMYMLQPYANTCKSQICASYKAEVHSSSQGFILSAIWPRSDLLCVLFEAVNPRVPDTITELLLLPPQHRLRQVGIRWVIKGFAQNVFLHLLVLAVRQILHVNLQPHIHVISICFYTLQSGVWSQL